MKKDFMIYVDDILNSIEKIENFCIGLDYNKFANNNLIIDAVIRNLEIIGEAVKKIPTNIKRRSDSIEWGKISGMRDFLIHRYSDIDLEIVWDAIKNKLPKLKSVINKIKDDFTLYAKMRGI